MMSGEKDCVVSKDEMKGLWDIASGRAAVPEGEPRQLKDMFISFKDGSHGSLQFFSHNKGLTVQRS